MDFITLNESQIKNTALYNIKQKHIVISITGGLDSELIIPNNINRVAELHVKFDDVLDLDDRFIYFNRGLAEDIINFVEQYCNQISCIVVQCKAGLSRSVAVAAALSKILNYVDDNVYIRGIPNMLVYTTLLDTFFAQLKWQQLWSKINYHRVRAMAQYLTPAIIRLNSAKEVNRLK